ncbi:helix-turn-helix domain-containing protein [Nonomuraea indica]|uniref:nSTAND1 domain-containing NTPase n=1 Tax=Nonomuraea indica TaxID=1581193 RepID=UPI000C7D3425|nr:helix-turn-helix domain-containing protein [Nonomuraea indica]
MTGVVEDEPDLPDPGRIRTRQDFARELTLLRERSGMTVRQVAVKIGVSGAHSTIGDWFAGRGLPSTALRDLLVRLLDACGADDPDTVEQWLRAWLRVRRAPGRRPAGAEPYKGLASFGPEDAAWFFGRETLTNLLLDRVDALRAAGGGVQVVVGASGAGKSSLLRAGLIPALSAGRVPGVALWPDPLLTPGAHPMSELAARLTPARPNGADAASPAEVMRPGPGDPAPVLVVDQFEEVFSACADEGERQAFVGALCSAADAGALIVVGLRADFYGRVLRHPRLVEAVQAGQVAVGPMSEAELRAAIVEPARKAKLELEEGLVELLLRDVAPPGGQEGTAHEAGVLPLLSHALYATWSRAQGRRLTIGDYREAGGIEGAVAASASKVYDELGPREREQARRLFLSLVHVASDTADTRRRMVTAELLAEGRDEGREDVLDRFVAQRLITADVDTVEISHEALLTAWPRLRSWLDADREGLVVGRRLAEAAATWHREHRDPAALYRGARLAAARAWVAGTTTGAQLSPLTREFLDASVARELEEQRAARRGTRRLRRLVAGLIVLFVVTAAAGVVAVRSQRETQEQRDMALAGNAAKEAAALRAVNPALAAQLNLAAYRLSPTAEARGGLLSAFASPYATLLTGQALAVYAAEFSPDARLLVTAALDGVVRLYDVADRHRPTAVATLTGHTDGVTAAVFAPGGRMLATASTDRTVRLWDLADARRPRAAAVLTGHASDVRRVSFSPDGRTLASASYDATVRLWDVTDPSRPAVLSVLTGRRDAAGLAVFSPDGRTLLTHGPGHSLRLWDVTDRRRPHVLARLAGHTDRVLSAAFDPSGHLLATGGFDAAVRLWDVSDPRHPGRPVTLAGHRNGVVSLAFSADARVLASGSYDTTVRLWDVSDPGAPASPVALEGHAGTVYTVSFSPDGRTLVSGAQDNTVRLWGLPGRVIGGHDGGVHAVALAPGGRLLGVGGHPTAGLWNVADLARPVRLATLRGHTDIVSRLAFRPDGRVLATASLDSTTRLWDVSVPARPVPLATLRGHTSNVFSAMFSPDGRTLATAGDDSTARLWDVTDPRRPRQVASITGHAAPVVSAVFGPSGRVLATASADHTTRLWDVTDPSRPTPLSVLTGHTSSVFRAQFSPDGRTLATAGADHTARLWDVTAPDRPVPLAVLTGHTSNINGLAFTPDGRTLATAGADRVLRIWDVTDPRAPGPPVTLSGHTDVLNAVAAAPDGRTLVTGADDSTVRLWDLDPGRVAAQVCALAHPRITSAQWARYLPGPAFQPPCR